MTSPLLPGCPWYDLHAKYPPNVNWCEEKICSIILTPFNTWTNLAYVLVGLWIWKKTRNSTNSVHRLFSSAAILVGVTSFVYHMSLNAFTQVFDFFGMYLFCVLMLMSNLSRMNRWPTDQNGKKGLQYFWFSVLALTAITYLSVLIHFPVQLYVLGLIIAIVYTELIQKVKSRRYFWLSLAAMIFGAIISALDVTHILCWPENHWFQGHGIWHIVTAVALYFAFLHSVENT